MLKQWWQLQRNILKTISDTFKEKAMLITYVRMTCKGKQCDNGEEQFGKAMVLISYIGPTGPHSRN